MREWYADHICPEPEGYSDGDEISTALLAKLTDAGKMCCECGCEFVKAHGKVAACTFCWSRLSLAEQKIVAKATHEEKNRVGIINEARKRKAKRKAK